MILIIGATGKVGTHLVTQLQAQQRPFRALAHSAASSERLVAQGVDTWRVDTLQQADMEAAFAGIDQVFLLTPSAPDQASVEHTYIDSARSVGVQQIVKLSVFGVDAPTVSLFRPHREVEQYLRQTDIGYTILRPSLFMQNLVTTDAATVQRDDAIYNGAGDGAINFIDTADIAAVALAVLGEPRHMGKTYELTGPTARTYLDVAMELSEHLNRSITYVPLDDDAFLAALHTAGLPAWYATALVDLYRFYREGNSERVTTTVEQITGQSARTIEHYLAENIAAFRG